MDAVTWKDAVMGLAAMVSGLLALVVGSHVKRFDKHEESETAKFDRLFQGHECIRREMGTGLSEVRQSISDLHITILKELNNKLDKPTAASRMKGDMDG